MPATHSTCIGRIHENAKQHGLGCNPGWGETTRMGFKFTYSCRSYNKIWVHTNPYESLSIQVNPYKSSWNHINVFISLYIYIYTHTSKTHINPLKSPLDPLDVLCEIPASSPCLQVQKAVFLTDQQAAVVIDRTSNVTGPSVSMETVSPFTTGYPKTDSLWWITALKWKTWGYRNFRKPPYEWSTDDGSWMINNNDC